MVTLQACETFGEADSPARLLGKDEDGDGVRDDVQRYINRKYNGPFNKWGRLALTDVARAFQATLASDSEDREIKVEAAKSLLSAQDCIYLLFERPFLLGWTLKNSEKMFDTIKKRVINTRARKAAFARINYAFGGQTYQLAMTPEEVCSFDTRGYRWSWWRLF